MLSWIYDLWYHADVRRAKPGSNFDVKCLKVKGFCFFQHNLGNMGIGAVVKHANTVGQKASMTSPCQHWPSSNQEVALIPSEQFQIQKLLL